MDYIEAAKKELGIESDHAMTKALNVSPTTISGYRHRNRKMDDKIAIKVAHILRVPEGQVLADMQAERAQDKLVKKAWKNLARTLQGAVAATLLVLTIGTMNPTSWGVAKGYGASEESLTPVYIMRNKSFIYCYSAIEFLRIYSPHSFLSR